MSTHTGTCLFPPIPHRLPLCHLNVLLFKTWQGFEYGRTADVASTTAKCDRRVVSRSNHVLHRAVRRNGVSRRHCSRTQARPATYLTPRQSAAIRVRVWGGRLSLQVRCSAHVPSGRHSLASNATSSYSSHDIQWLAHFFYAHTFASKETNVFPWSIPSEYPFAHGSMRDLTCPPPPFLPSS